MAEHYKIEDREQLLSPGLVVFRDLVLANLRRMLEIAGHSDRLRPHCKTHKMPALTALELELGIHKHKCATFAEAEMLALAGVKDVFLAYNLVGPNISRAVAFKKRFPDVDLSVTADHPGPVAALDRAMSTAGETIDVLLDLDCGLNRTGITEQAAALSLYRQIADAKGLRAGGLHLYDGQNHQTSLAERGTAVDNCWQQAIDLKDLLRAEALPVPRIVAGGTGSFPLYATKTEPTLELSPGTTVFHDASYAEMFPDLQFIPAALLLTRVISRPAHNRVTFDLGTKACAADPPAGKRLLFPEIPDAKEILQNEEHLVLETSQAEHFKPGDSTLAIPRHICPTSALHQHAWVIAEGQIVDCWQVTARDRQLSI